jgi:Ca-activated chloride channel family protein
MRKIALLIAVLFLMPATSFAARLPKKEVKKGNLLYNKGSFDEALKEYDQALEVAPDSDVVNFNLGSTLYKTEDFQGAIGHLEKSLLSESESLQQKAHYNTGNAKYQYGIAQEESALPAAVDLLTQSLHHYEKAVALDPDDEDAKNNHEFVAKELERLKEKLKQQQQSQKQKGSEQKEQQAEQSQQQQEEAQEEQTEQRQSKQKEGKQEQAEQRQAQETPSEEEAGGQAHEEEQIPGQMSEKEAQMLLESYAHEEEPQGLLKPVMPREDVSKVLKDW